jgi:hypothetical protein
MGNLAVLLFVVIGAVPPTEPPDPHGFYGDTDGTGCESG